MGCFRGSSCYFSHSEEKSAPCQYAKECVFPSYGKCKYYHEEDSTVIEEKKQKEKSLQVTATPPTQDILKLKENKEHGQKLFDELMTLVSRIAEDSSRISSKKEKRGTGEIEITDKWEAVKSGKIAKCEFLSWIMILGNVQWREYASHDEHSIQVQHHGAIAAAKQAQQPQKIQPQQAQTSPQRRGKEECSAEISFRQVD